MNDKREQNKKYDVADIKEIKSVLDGLINNESTKHYFGLGENGEKYKTVPTRYEAWIMASALSNIVLIDRIEKLTEIINKRRK